MASTTKYLGLLLLFLNLGLTLGSVSVKDPLTDNGYLTDLIKNVRRRLGSKSGTKNGLDKSYAVVEKKILEISPNDLDAPVVDGCLITDTRVHCSGENVTEVPQNLHRNITSISFRSTSIGIIPDDIFRNYKDLSWIDFANNKNLTVMSSGAFQGLAKLTRLALIENDLLDDSSFGNETFKGLSALTHLYCFSCKLTKLPKYLLGGTRKLIYLVIYNNMIVQTGLELISPLDKLAHLHLSHNKLMSLEASMFSKMANLEALDVSYNPITIIKSGTLKGLDKLEHFKATNYYSWKSGLTIEDDALNTNLRFLDLDGSRHLNISTLALMNLPALENISLSVCDLTYLDGAAFMYKPNLSKVDISSNDFVCDCGASWMADAVIEGRPWAVDWGVNGTSRPPRCESPQWLYNKEIPDLYPQDLTCDTPDIEAITPTFLHYDWSNKLTFKARLTKGYPKAEWVFPDGYVIWDWSRLYTSHGSVDDTIVDSDHSVLTQCTVSDDYNMVGLVNFTLVASNVAGHTNMTYWVFVEPRPTPTPSAAMKGTPTVGILVLLFVQWICTIVYPHV